MKLENKIIVKDIPEDFVRCKECDRPMQQITVTHLNRHGMTMDYYKKKYPNAILRNAKLRIEQSKRLKKEFKKRQSKRSKNFLNAIDSKKRKEIIKKSHSKKSIKKNVESRKILYNKIPKLKKHWLQKMEKVWESKKYSDEFLIKKYMKVKTKLNRIPSGIEFEKYSNISRQVYDVRWGSFNNFVKLMGDKPKKIYSLDTNELILDIVRVWSELGRQPTQEEYSKLGEFHHSVVYHKLRMRWSDLMISMGGDNLGWLQGGYNKIPESILEEEYVRIRKQINRPLTQYDFEEYCKYHYAVYQRRWGSLGKAREYLERKYFDKLFDNNLFYRKLLSKTISKSKSIEG